MSIMNPSLFSLGIEGIKALQGVPVDKRENLDDILKCWGAPFTGVSLMSNRQTPDHRDTLGCNRGMDLLTTVGPYEDGTLTLTGLGVQFQYDSGTVVGISGREVIHRADANGERLCVAYYMRDNVVKALGLGSPAFTLISEIEQIK